MYSLSSPVGVNGFLLEETRKLRLREEKGPVWGQRGSEAGTGGRRPEGGRCVGRGKRGAVHLPFQGLPPSPTHWKRELVKGELEWRERKQTESEKSLGLQVLGLFGLAEPPPGPLPTALQTGPNTPRHTCACTRTHAHIRAQLHTGTRHTRSHTVRHAHVHTNTQDTRVCI